jgi:hypothetical protein
MIRGDADVRCALFKHLDNRSQDASDRAEGRAFRWHTPHAVIVAKQLVSAVDEVNNHVAGTLGLIEQATCCEYRSASRRGPGNVVSIIRPDAV